MRNFQRQRGACRSAFTLVEVILAIGIAIGILVIALFFYQQSANLRAQILEESDHISAIRHLTDQLTVDLRAARAHDWHGFTGNAQSIRFVKAEALSSPAWRQGQPQTDLKLITFGATTGQSGTNLFVTGIARDEQALIAPRSLSSTHPSAFPSESPSSAASESSASVTNLMSEPLTDAIRFVRFRYWDGKGWIDSWDAIAPPPAVEMSFGTEPMPDEVTVEEYPFELFRRVVWLPGGEASDKGDLFSEKGSKAGVTVGKL